MSKNTRQSNLGSLSLDAQSPSVKDVFEYHLKDSLCKICVAMFNVSCKWFIDQIHCRVPKILNNLISETKPVLTGHSKT